MTTDTNVTLFEQQYTRYSPDEIAIIFMDCLEFGLLAVDDDSLKADYQIMANRHEAVCNLHLGCLSTLWDAKKILEL